LAALLNAAPAFRATVLTLATLSLTADRAGLDLRPPTFFAAPVLRVAADFLRRLIAAVPYRIHTILTDNGTHFTDPGAGGSAVPEIIAALEAGEIFRAHAFELACARAGVEHRLTRPNHPWTNGQVERMNRTLKEATVRRFHYESHGQLRAHLADFVNAYNFAKRLKTLRGLTPFEFISKQWIAEPHRFLRSPDHLTAGLNI